MSARISAKTASEWYAKYNAMMICFRITIAINCTFQNVGKKIVICFNSSLLTYSLVTSPNIIIKNIFYFPDTYMF